MIFAKQTFSERIDLTVTLDPDPSQWEVPGLKQWPSEELLKTLSVGEAKQG